MPPKNASRTVSVTARFPLSVSRFRPGSCPARHAIFVAGEAGGMRELEGTQSLCEGVPHPGLRFVDQNRADVDASGSDHPARGALELLGFIGGQLPAFERLPRLVGPQALL